MESTIDSLVDDCLLYIFKFFDLIDLVPIAQVCSRWKQLTESRLNKITEVRVLDPEECYRNNWLNWRPSKSTSLVKLKSVLEFLGPQVKSVKLGDCHVKTLFLGERFGYNFSDKYNRKEFTSMLTQTCPNISEMQIGKSHIKFSEQLIKSSKNLRKLKLPNYQSLMFPGCTFETIEEVVWEISEGSNATNFNSLFPNLKKMVLVVSAQPLNIDTTIGSVLRQVKDLKALDIYFNTEMKAKPYFRFLSHVSLLSELEELRIWKAHCDDIVPEFNAKTVHQLTEKCLNLRSVSIFDISFGKTDVSAFLRLPKLEQLDLAKVQVFGSKFLSDSKPTEVKNLKSLYVIFDDKNFNLSDFYAAMEKMPALKYLTTFLPEKEKFEFTRELIKRQVFERDVIVSPFGSDKFRVSSNLNKQSSSEPLLVSIGCLKGDEYYDQVRKFVDSLGNCSMVPADREDLTGLYEDDAQDYVTSYDRCSCIEVIRHGCGCCGHSDDEVDLIEDDNEDEDTDEDEWEDLDEEEDELSAQDAFLNLLLEAFRRAGQFHFNNEDDEIDD